MSETYEFEWRFPESGRRMCVFVKRSVGATIVENAGGIISYLVF